METYSVWFNQETQVILIIIGIVGIIFAIKAFVTQINNNFENVINKDIIIALICFVLIIILNLFV